MKYSKHVGKNEQNAWWTKCHLFFLYVSFVVLKAWNTTNNKFFSRKKNVNRIIGNMKNFRFCVFWHDDARYGWLWLIHIYVCIVCNVGNRETATFHSFSTSYFFHPMILSRFFRSVGVSLHVCTTRLKFIHRTNNTNVLLVAYSKKKNDEEEEEIVIVKLNDVKINVSIWR